MKGRMIRWAEHEPRCSPSGNLFTAMNSWDRWLEAREAYLEKAGLSRQCTKPVKATEKIFIYHNLSKLHFLFKAKSRLCLW